MYISCENEAGKVFNLILPTSNLVKPKNLRLNSVNIDERHASYNLPDYTVLSNELEWWEFKGSYNIYSDSLSIIPDALNVNGIVTAKTTITLGVKGTAFRQELQVFQKGLLFDENTTFDLAKNVIKDLLS